MTYQTLYKVYKLNQTQIKSKNLGTNKINLFKKKKKNYKKRVEN